MTPSELAEDLVESLVEWLDEDSYGDILHAHLTHVSVCRTRDDFTLIMWLDERWSYTVITGKKMMRLIEIFVEGYAVNELDFSGTVRVIVGRVNRRRKR